jgi:hypothetical protein
MSGSGPIASGDLNGDGNTDLAVVDSIDNTVTILLGDGRGRFHLGAPTPFSGWGGDSSLAVGDFNGDGRLDVAVLNEKLNVCWATAPAASHRRPARRRRFPHSGSRRRPAPSPATVAQSWPWWTRPGTSRCTPATPPAR